MKQLIKVDREQEGIVLISGIAYSRVISWFDATMRDLKMDILMPKVRAGHAPCPAILWFCGGAFKEMNRSVWIPPLVSLANKGYVVVSADYRTSNEQSFPTQLEDAKAAVRFMKAHAAEFCIDPNRIAVAGESAGGTIASLVGVTAKHKEFDVGDNLEYDSSVAAVLDFYGLTDMSLGKGDFGDETPVPSWCMEAFMGYHYKEEKRASAINYVDDDTPPFMILHGSADPLVDIKNSELLYELLQKHGREAEFYTLEGAVHGDDLFYQECMMERIDAFLKRVMP